MRPAREAAPIAGAMDFIGGGQNRSESLVHLFRESSFWHKKPDVFPSFTGLGFIFSASGLVVTMLGVTMFFNAGLLRLGNLLFLAGLPLIIGPGRTVTYFSKRARLRATATFLVGVFLVIFAGWPVIGLLVEAFGFLNLFGNLFPLLKGVIRQMPFAGDVLGKRQENRWEDQD
jgi:hypothetical protein